jgi:carbohydrate-selective porin OprB
LSAPHRQFLAQGGMGYFIGDGRLNYRDEQIFEAYYSWAVAPNVWLSADLQHMRNPAYNRDRGPVNLGAMRLHFEL